MKKISPEIGLFICWDICEPVNGNIENVDKVVALLEISVGRILQNIVNKGFPFYRDVVLFDHQETLYHIRDWLVAAVRNNEAWLSNVDEFGRPKKLMKFNSLSQMSKEADKAMMIANQKIGQLILDDAHEKLYQELESGYSLVQMLSPEALDRESSYMQHCIGHGAFDNGLKDEETVYLSLRDPAGKPHITFFLNKSNNGFEIVEIQGKQNKPPLTKYLRALDGWKDLSKCSFTWRYQGYVIDNENRLHYSYELPDDIVVVSDLSLNLSVDRLPVRIHALKNVEIKGSHQSSPKIILEGWIIEGNLNFSSLKMHISSDTKILGNIVCDHSKLTVGDNCTFGSLYFKQGTIDSIGTNFEVKNNFSLKEAHCKMLPNDAKINKLSMDVFDVKKMSQTRKKYEALNITNNNDGGNIPNDLNVVAFNINNSADIKMPAKLCVEQTFHAHRSLINNFSGEWELKGNVFLQECKILVMSGTILVEDDFILTGSTIRKLPDAIISECGTVSFNSTNIKTLPNKIHCAALDLRECKNLNMERLPHCDINCQAIIISPSQKNMILPDTWKVRHVTIKTSRGSTITEASDFRAKKTPKIKFVRERRIANI